MKDKASFVQSCLESQCVEITGFQFSGGDDWDYRKNRNNHDAVEHCAPDSSKNGNNECREPVDLETAISQAGYGRYNYYLLFVAMPVAFTNVLIATGTSLVVPAIGCDFPISNVEKGLLQVSGFFGMTISAFFWGSLSDSFGRRKLIIYGFIVDGLVGVAASLAPSYWILVLLKTLNGAVNSGPYSIFAAYQSEIFPKIHRDVAVLLFAMFAALATVFQPVVSLVIMWYLPFTPWNVFGDYKFTSWRVFLIALSLPSLISGVCCIFTLESPKFLLEKGRKDEALAVLKTVFAINSGLPESAYPVRNIQEAKPPSDDVATEPSFWQRVGKGISLSFSLFRRPYVGRAMYIFLIQFGTMAGGHGIRLWLPQIFTTAEAAGSSNSTSEGGICDLLTASTSGNESSTSECELSSPTSYINMVIINSALFITFPLFFGCAKVFGKKASLVMTTLLPSFFVFSIPFVPFSYVVYIAGLHVSLCSLSFFALLSLVVEIFPTEVRATSVSMSQTIGRLGALFANIFVSLFVFNFCSAVIFGLAALVFVIALIAIVLPTTPIEPVGHETKPYPSQET